jgi:glycosyltransferase involved in cell wall biosynthesis
MESIKDVTKGRATVSVAVIAKNEAATIIPLIESVREVVDEIVILVDDTTIDNTKQLAEENGATVYSFTWKEDFAGARNEAIKKCTKDFIFILDGHEILHPKSKQVLVDILFRVYGNRDLHDTEVFLGYAYLNPEQLGEGVENLLPETALMQPRLFRNNGDHYYVGRVHNYLYTKETNKTLKRPIAELVVIHKRTEENAVVRQQQRADMNVRILKEELEKDPSNTRNLFYLANTYYETTQYDLAIACYTKYLTLSTWKTERAEASYMLGCIYSEKKDYTNAEAIMLDAIKEDSYRPEFYILLGDIMFQQQQWYNAAHWYKCATEMRLPVKTGMFLRGASYSYLPYLKLAMVWSTTENFWEAILAGEKAIQLGYNKPDLLDKMKIWKEQMSLKPNAKNIIFYDENGAFTFLKDLINRLSETYNTCTADNYSHEVAQWANVIWFEWCARNVVQATGMKKKEGQKWIVRLHGYELYSPKRINQIQWDKVDVLIFVAEHIKKHFNELYTISPNVKQVVIPNGIEINNFDFADRNLTKEKNIGVIGILTEKKGPQLLIQIMRHFEKVHPDFKFLLRFDVPEKPSMSYRILMHGIRDLKNWIWVERQESLNSWMENLKYILSTSELESFSFVVGEAMTKGIKPLIYDWVGASELWPEYLIWKDLIDLDRMLKTPYTSLVYREFVSKNYSADKLTSSVIREVNHLLGVSSGIEEVGKNI